MLAHMHRHWSRVVRIRSSVHALHRLNAEVQQLHGSLQSVEADWQRKGSEGQELHAANDRCAHSWYPPC